MKRRDFLKLAGVSAAALAAPQRLWAKGKSMQPNIILCMTDDQGWGDVGYNRHKVLKTPNLDAMSREGIRFDRFYAGAPVCSPTRGSCITGRHPYRYGIFFANVGHMPKEEITLAEALKTRGYVTGHFGKWHLGTLTKTVIDGRRGGRQNQHYSPPWENGFDECFSTEVAIPTWDPMKDQPFPSKYWTGPNARAGDNLDGDDSRVIMDRAVPFIKRAAKAGKPFLAVIWFHTPHEKVRAGKAYRAMYKDQPEKKQHYYGCLTAMDEQFGRLRKTLADLGIADNTMLWFCSDNGPEHRTGPGSTGGLRGRKRDLYEGGVRVPGMLVWPDRVKTPRTVTMPCSTSDYFPTVLDVLGFKMPDQPLPMDGVSLLGLLEGKLTERPRPIGFESQKQIALMDNQYKVISTNRAKTWQLYDIVADRAETHDLADKQPKVVAAMSKTLLAWKKSCDRSRAGKDYTKN